MHKDFALSLIVVVWTIISYCGVCYLCYMCKVDITERNVCLVQHMNQHNKRAFYFTEDCILLRMPALIKLLPFSFIFRLQRTPAHLIFHRYAFPHFILHVCLFATSISALTPYLSIS